MGNSFQNNDTVSWDHSRGILTIKDNLNKQAIKISEEAILMLAERIREGSVTLGKDRAEASSPYGEYSHELTVDELPPFVHSDWNPYSWAASTIQIPKMVGEWVVGDGWVVGLKTRPQQTHIDNTKLLLGWEWRDYK